MSAPNYSFTQPLVPNGTQTVFLLNYTPAAGSLLVIHNGVIMSEGDDYALSGSTIIFNVAPGSSDELSAFYAAAEANLSGTVGPGTQFSSEVVAKNTNGELNDVVLKMFLSTLVAGLTGIPGNLVRPRWQPNPPNEPEFETDWSAVGVVRRTRDVFAFDGYIRAGQEQEPCQRVIRNQILETIASFYGPNAEQNSESFAMGLSFARNREQMFLNGFGLVEVQETLTVPALIKERWLSGVDVPFRMRRQQIYEFPNAYLLAANGTITLDDGTVIKLGVDGQSGYGISPYGIVRYGGG